ncbi:MAG: MarR family transcriptional regulator [Deltaproteobacteria bacterium]|nr:MarR family transcriptional regulator [Deltaproteobacteria bacterium]
MLTKKRHYSLENYRLDESVGFLLQQASNTVDRMLTEGLKKKCPDSTAAQWKILMLIGNRKCGNAAELSAVINCDMGSVSRMLDRLEAKRLVKRTRSTSDRRQIDLSLTGAGAELFPRLPEVSVDMMNELLKDFTEKEVGQFKLFLRRIIR